jgi:hypothetical protein
MSTRSRFFRIHRKDSSIISRHSLIPRIFQFHHFHELKSQLVGAEFLPHSRIESLIRIHRDLAMDLGSFVIVVAGLG